MSRVFEARYSGRCAACDERIKPGDDVCYEGDDLIHEGCQDRPTVEPKQQAACPSCWLVGPCDCGSDR